MTSLILAFALAPVWGVSLRQDGLCFCGKVPAAQGRAAGGSEPAVSVLKPLYGTEPGLYENLLSFRIDQGLSCAVQIVFGVRGSDDGALPIARRVIAERPERDIALVIDSRVSGRNLKVANLVNMLPAARHDTLVFADSDMRVGRDYLATR